MEQHSCGLHHRLRPPALGTCPQKSGRPCDWSLARQIDHQASRRGRCAVQSAALHSLDWKGCRFRQSLRIDRKFALVSGCSRQGLRRRLFSFPDRGSWRTAGYPTAIKSPRNSLFSTSTVPESKFDRAFLRTPQVLQTQSNALGQTCQIVPRVCTCLLRHLLVGLIVNTP